MHSRLISFMQYELKANLDHRGELEMFHYVLPTALCNIRLPSFRMQPLVLGALSVFVQ